VRSDPTGSEPVTAVSAAWTYLGGPDDHRLGVLQLQGPLYHSVLLHLQREDAKPPAISEEHNAP
jgi:hypothetical protein